MKIGRVSVLRLLAIVIFLHAPLINAFEVERGIEFGSSCDQIRQIEGNLGSTILGSGTDPLIGFRGTYKGHIATIVYNCRIEDWSQLIVYGMFSEEEATNETHVLSTLMEEKYGTPSYSYDGLSWWKKLALFFQSYFDDPEFYRRFKATKLWQYDKAEVSIDFDKARSPDNYEVFTWSVRHSISTPMKVKLCSGGECENVTFVEIEKQNKLDE